MPDVNDLGDESPQSPTPLHAREAGKKFRQAAFLAAFAELGRVNKAAERAGVDRWTHYEWMKTDSDYVEQFQRAELLAFQQAEDELYRRGVEGYDTLKTIAGAAVTIREYSDRCLEIYLRGAKPEKYRDRQSIEHTGKDGKPLLDLSAVHAFLRGTEE